MSYKPMSYGTNTVILDHPTLMRLLQEWVQEQFQPIIHNDLRVTKVHMTRSGKLHVTIRGSKAPLELPLPEKQEEDAA